MVNKNIQMKARNGNEWDNLFPLTLTENVFDNEGNNIEYMLNTFKDNITDDMNTLTNTLENEFDYLNEFVVNVKKHGIIGDGITDYTSDIQTLVNEIESRGGGILFFPKGTYLLTTPLEIGSGVHVLGVGKDTIFEGDLRQTAGSTAMFVNKGRNNSGSYSGASGYKIENIALNSENQTMQGIYTDNASDFTFQRIYGLGKTKDHWFDINNSKNGIIKDCYLIHGRNSDIQIDAREGENDGLIIENIFIENKTPSSDYSNIAHAQAGIHFHRGNAHNVKINNIFMNGVDVGVYQDKGIKINNISMTNFILHDVIQSISMLGGNDPTGLHSKNVTIRDWEIYSENTRYAIGFISGVDNLIIKDIYANVDNTTRFDNTKGQLPLALVDCKNSYIGRMVLEGSYPFEEDIFKNVFYHSSLENITIDNEHEGEWTPSIVNDTGTVYSRQDGYFKRRGNMVYVTGRLNITEKGGFNNFTITGVPYPIDTSGSNMRFMGTVGSVRFENDIPITISSGGADDQIIVRQAGHMTTLGHDHFHSTEPTVINFSLEYKTPLKSR